MPTVQHLFIIPAHCNNQGIYLTLADLLHR